MINTAFKVYVQALQICTCLCAISCIYEYARGEAATRPAVLFVFLRDLLP